MRQSKAEPRGRIFIDYLRNDPTATAVAPYSTRAEMARLAQRLPEPPRRTDAWER